MTDNIFHKVREEILNIPLTDPEGYNGNGFRDPAVIMYDVLQIIDKYAEQESETVTEFADRCRECGAKYGKLLKQKLQESGEK